MAGLADQEAVVEGQGDGQFGQEEQVLHCLPLQEGSGSWQRVLREVPYCLGEQMCLEHVVLGSQEFAIPMEVQLST